MEIELDCETIKVDHHSPEFKVLFNGFYNPKDNFLYQGPCDVTIASDELVTFIGHNIKFDLKCLLKQGYSLSDKFYDTQIAVHILREDLDSHGYKLENLAKLLYQYPNYKKMIDFEREEYWNDIGWLKLYNKHDLIFTKQLKDLTEPRLKQTGKWPLFQMMMEYVKHLTIFEMKGIKIDIEELDRQGAIWTAKRNKTLEELRNYSSKLDWDSDTSKSVKEYFHKYFKVPLTEKKNIKLNELVLKDLVENQESKEAELVLILRACTKQIGTYNEGFRSRLYEGYYYPDYSLIATLTGRLSEHFIQVMPRKETSEFKKCIISKFPGGYLLSNDWSRLEALLQAELVWIVTGKHKLADDLISGYDIHDATLKRFKFLPDRTRAKNANFSTIFGGRGYTLVQDYGFTWPQAKEFVHDLTVIRYPELSELFGIIGARIIGEKYVEHPYTHRGRHTDNYNEGLNAPIQGIGTDYNKIMTIVLSEKLQGYQSHVCLDCHDDLTIDTHPDEKNEVIHIVKKTYDNFAEHFYRFFGIELKVKYNAEHKIGRNLYDMEKIA